MAAGDVTRAVLIRLGVKQENLAGPFKDLQAHAESGKRAVEGVQTALAGAGKSASSFKPPQLPDMVQRLRQEFAGPAARQSVPDQVQRVRQEVSPSRFAVPDVRMQVVADLQRARQDMLGLRTDVGRGASLPVRGQMSAAEQALQHLRQDVGRGAALPVRADAAAALQGLDQVRRQAERPAHLRVSQEFAGGLARPTIPDQVQRVRQEMMGGLARPALPDQVQRIRQEFAGGVPARPAPLDLTQRIRQEMTGGLARPTIPDARMQIIADLRQAQASLTGLRTDVGRGAALPVRTDPAAALQSLDQIRRQAESRAVQMRVGVDQQGLQAATAAMRLGPQAVPIRPVADQVQRVRQEFTGGLPTRPAPLDQVQRVRQELAGSMPTRPVPDARMQVVADIRQAQASLGGLRADATRGATLPVRGQISAAEQQLQQLRQQAGRGAALPLRTELAAVLQAVDQLRKQVEGKVMQAKIGIDPTSFTRAQQDVQQAVAGMRAGVPAPLATKPVRQLDERTAGQLRERIGGIKEEFGTVSTFKGQASEMWKGMIGASSADDTVTKLQAKLSDSLRTLSKQTLTIDANPGPALASLRKIRGDLETLKTAAGSAAAGMLTGFQRAGDGLMGMARGLTLLSAGNKGLEQAAQTLMKFQAIADLGRGVYSLVTGIAGGFSNLTRWTETMRSGAAMQREFGVAAGQVETALQRQGVATQASSQSVSRTVPPTSAAAQQTRLWGVALERVAAPTRVLDAHIARLTGGLQQEALAADNAARANSRLAGSHMAAADAAATHRAMSGTAAAGPSGVAPAGYGGRFAGLKGAAGFAAFGGALAAGTTLASGGSAGEAAGAGVGGMAVGLGSQLLLAKMMAPKAAGAAGAGAAAAGGAAAKAAPGFWTLGGSHAGAGAGTIGGAAAATVLGGLALIANFGMDDRNSPGSNRTGANARRNQDWMMRNVIPESWLPGGKKPYEMEEVRKKQKDLEATGGASSEEVARRQIAQGDWLKEFAPKGFRTWQEEQRKERDISVRRPFDDQGRQLDEVRARQGDMLGGFRIEDRRYQEGRQVEDKRQRFSNALAESAKQGSPQQMVEVWKQTDAIQKEIAAGSKGSVASEVAITQAAEEHKRALAEQAKLQKQLESDQKKTREGASDRRTHAEQRYTAEQLAAANERVLATSQKITAATREHGLAERQRIDGWRSWASEAQKFYQDIAKQERERIKGLTTGLGLQSAEDRQRTLTVAKKLKANVEGQGPELTKEEMEHARGSEVLRPLLERKGEQVAAQDPRIAEIIKLTGQDSKAKAAEDAAKKFGEIKVAMEQKITAEIKVNEQGIVDQLGKQVLPQISKMVIDMEQRLKLEMQRMEAEVSAGKKGIAGP